MIVPGGGDRCASAGHTGPGAGHVPAVQRGQRGRRAAAVGRARRDHQAQKLWTAITAETGNLKVVGLKEEQRDKIFGRLAAILQTATGRKFLAYLVENAPVETKILFNEAESLKAVGLGGTTQESSFAAPMQPGGKEKLKARGSGGKKVTTPEGFIDALIATGADPPTSSRSAAPPTRAATASPRRR